jgi:hypothetical protein
MRRLGWPPNVSDFVSVLKTALVEPGERPCVAKTFVQNINAILCVLCFIHKVTCVFFLVLETDLHAKPGSHKRAMWSLRNTHTRLIPRKAAMLSVVGVLLLFMP